MTLRAPVHLTIALSSFSVALGCTDVTRFSSNGDHYEGTIIAGDFVRAGFESQVGLCVVLDASRLQDAPGTISSSDGRFRNTALRPIPQVWHDSLATISFGDGRIQNLIYVVTPLVAADAFGDVVAVVSLMQTGSVEVRLFRGAPAIDAGAGGNSLFGVFSRPDSHGGAVLVLGIESSCDETGAALVLDDGRVASDVVQTQVRLHAEYGGVVPELASRDHVKNVTHVVREAMTRASVGWDAIDGVAVTNRPGLVGALLVGVQAAKGIAWAAGKPLVGVDHLVGHLLAVFLRRGEAAWTVPAFPFVALLASGGHTAIYRVDAPHAGDVRELGATRDDAAGEAFDKVAKLLGLGYPGGPVIDRLAVQGDPTRVKLIAPMANASSLEFSFSGIKTQVARWVAEHGVPKEPGALADVCASFQKAVTDVLASKLVAAAGREGVRDVVLGGGVAANSQLRARTAALAAERGLTAFVPPLASCTDNAAMIAYAGAMRLARGDSDSWDLVATSQTALPRATRKGRGAR